MKIEVKTLNSIIIYNQWRIYGLRGGSRSTGHPPEKNQNQNIVPEA